VIFKVDKVIAPLYCIYPVSKLLANCRQIGIKLAQRLVTNPVPSVSAISLCFASKACVHNVTANWQQKPSKFCVTLFDDKLATKIEQILYSTTPILRDNMQALLGFCCQFVRLREYFSLYFAMDLQSKYVSRFCYVFASILSTWSNVSKFVLNLYPFC